jgi:hypothetical protein
MLKGVVKNPKFQEYVKDPKIKEWLGALKDATRQAYDWRLLVLCHGSQPYGFPVS